MQFDYNDIIIVLSSNTLHFLILKFRNTIFS